MNILMLDYKRQLILNKIKKQDNKEIYIICENILKKEFISISEKNILLNSLESLNILNKGGLFESWIYDFVENDI